MGIKIRKGDRVQVIAGDDKGKIGRASCRERVLTGV